MLECNCRWTHNTQITQGGLVCEDRPSKILGHTSFKTSSRYIHVFTDHFKAIAEKIDQLCNILD